MEISRRSSPPMAGPHDALFKYAFSDAEEAATLLRGVLPSSLGKTVDWTTLRMVPGTYVDEELSSRYSDILYEAKSGARSVLFYLLVEHQSTVVWFMAFRMLRYLTRIWDRWLKAHPKARRLPQVVPVVVYAGEGPWDAPTELEGLIEGDSVAWSPRMRFLLDDLTQLSEPELARRNLSVFAELAVRALTRLRSTDAPLDELRSWLPLLERLLRAKNGLHRFRALIEYLTLVANFEPDSLQPIVKQLGPAAEETAMTAAERLRQEGREQGLEQGARSARVEMFLIPLRMRFGDATPPEVLARVEAATKAELETWMGRIFAAQTLSEVFE